MPGRRLSSKGWLSLGLAFVLPMITAGGVSACPLCYQAAQQMMTEGVRLDSTERAVLAARDGADGPLRIVAVVKGADAVGAVVAEPVTEAPEGLAAAGEPSLLIREPAASGWTSLGAIPLEPGLDFGRIGARPRSAGGRRLAQKDRRDPRRPRRTPAQDLASDPLDRGRLELRRLAAAGGARCSLSRNPNPLTARLAWGELARAPYATLELAQRRAAYLTLLGFVGGPEDGARLDRRIEAALASHDSTDLGAMIATDLALGGASHVGWIETRVFADRKRTMPEIEAALLALNVLGDANDAMTRARVIEAYRNFIRERPPMAGFVAMQLAGWNCWDAAADYAALVKSGAVTDPSSEFAITNYTLVAALAAGTTIAWVRIAWRVLGSWIAASGLLLLGWVLRSVKG